MAVLKVYNGTTWVDVALSSHAATHTDGSDDVQIATASQKGLATATQITKLDGIESAATADQTAAEIKTAYESNADTNEFDDAEQTKLAGIEALADVTDAVNVAAAGAAMLSEAETITNDWTFSADKKLLFRDAGIFLHSNADGELTIEADGKVNIPADTDLTGVLTIVGSGKIDDVTINGKIVECLGAADDLTLRGGSAAQVVFGRDGDFDIFGSVKRRFGPAQALKATLGSAALPFAEAFIHGLLDASVVGVRGRYKAANFSDPPKDSELDTQLGTPATLGSGYEAVIEATTGGKRWIVKTDGTGWYYAAALTLAVG